MGRERPSEMSDLGLRGPLLLPHNRDLRPLMLADLSTPNPDLKEEIVTYAAGLGTGQIAALRGFRFQVPLQLECSALTTLRVAGVLPWQRDEALHHHLGEEAEAVSRKLEDEEDVGLAMEEWPTCMP